MDPRDADWGLYRRAYEKDSCGFGLIANLDDEPSHWLVQTAISSLNRLTHRGAIAADGKTGDGCGLLIKMPRGFCARWPRSPGFKLGAAVRRRPRVPEPRRAQAAQARARARREIEREKLGVAGFRPCPSTVRPAATEALKTLAAHRAGVRQLPAPTSTRRRFNRRLYMARRRAEKARGGRPGVLRPVPVGEHHRLQGHGDAAVSWRSSIPTSRIRGWKPRWWCSTSASPPTPCRSGAWRTRTVISRTTARSIPCRATAPGRWRAGPLFRSPLLPDLGDVLPVVSLHRVGLAVARQHARAAADGRARSDARDAHAGAAGLAVGRHDRSGPQGVLRVLRDAHGALGRAGRHRAHRRPLRLLHARPQRSASGALGDHQEPAHHHRLGGRGVGLPAGGRGAQGQARSRRNAGARSADRPS